MLNGITRDTVISLAGDLSLPVTEERIVRDRLYSADEVFICGTAAEVASVHEIECRRIGGGSPGPVTRSIQHPFHQVVQGDHARSSAWLSRVPCEAIDSTTER